LTDNQGLFTPITLHTDAEGKVVFSGLDDETYTWHWSWQGIAHQHSEQIFCSKITWEFTEKVDYWTVSKTFLYTETGDPIVGLDVTLGAETAKTDATGTVYFYNLKAGDYTLEWMWGSEPRTHDFTIGFQEPSPYDLGINYQESKSGGGNKSTLA